MRRLLLCLAALALAVTARAQSAPASDRLAPLDFLLGTWTATTGAGTAKATVVGNYTFARDLDNHVIQRTGVPSSCKGPQDFDCAHRDQLSIYPEGDTLAALYLDNEGHVIHYAITTPDAHTAIFLSTTPGPKFKLTYHLEGSGPKAIMSGKFQFAPPGSDDFHSYLEWSGTKQ